ncbi:MAG: SMI1/KNR4 family protein [Phycisphaerales bacterium]|nr:SMI1/KNR4 family protein [Phycisphaerales bacterium]
MAERIDRYIERLELSKGASSKAITELEKKLLIQLPADYQTFMEQSNGAEGIIGTEGYLSLWPIEEIADLNNEYSVTEFAPGLVIFGSDGGDTAYAFDTKKSPPEIVTVPFIGMDLKEVKDYATTFNEFLKNLYQESD